MTKEIVRRITKHLGYQIIAAAMKDSFEKRFEEAEEQLASAYIRLYLEKHPKFFEMITDPEVHDYMRYNSGTYIYTWEPRENASPKRDSVIGLGWKVIVENGRFEQVNFAPQVHRFLPCKNEGLPIDAPEVVQMEALFKQAEEAYQLLRQVVFSFHTVAALEKEAPHLARFVPQVDEPKRLPVSPTKGLLEQLAALGVPKG